VVAASAMKMEHIAERAGVGTQTVNRLSTKDELLLEAVSTSPE
jgi:AcrR family transcriptional regulator